MVYSALGLPDRRWLAGYRNLASMTQRAAEQACRRRAEDFSLEACADAYVSLYAEVLRAAQS